MCVTQSEVPVLRWKPMCVCDTESGRGASMEADVYVCDTESGRGASMESDVYVCV